MLKKNMYACIIASLLIIAVPVVSLAGSEKDVNLKKEIKELILQLGNPDKKRAKEAARCLVEIGEPAVQELINEIKIEGESQVEAIDILVKIGSKECLPILLEAAQRDSAVQWCALEALGKIGDKSAVSVLLKALKSDDHTARLKAIEALGKLKPKSAVPELIEALEEERDDWNRMELALVLARLGSTAGYDVAVEFIGTAVEYTSYQIFQELKNNPEVELTDKQREFIEEHLDQPFSAELPEFLLGQQIETLSTIEITQDGQVTLNGEQIELDELSNKLSIVASWPTDESLEIIDEAKSSAVINISSNVKGEVIAPVLDICRVSGIRKVIIQINNK